MQYLAIAIRALIVIIGVCMIIENPAGTPPFSSGIAFILIAASLCLNRMMAVKGTPCLIKCVNKNKKK